MEEYILSSIPDDLKEITKGLRVVDTRYFSYLFAKDLDNDTSIYHQYICNGNGGYIYKTYMGRTSGEHPVKTTMPTGNVRINIITERIE